MIFYLTFAIDQEKYSKVYLSMIAKGPALPMTTLAVQSLGDLSPLICRVCQMYAMRLGYCCTPKFEVVHHMHT